ncbi:unnamed protein product, partial [Closterium sp. NIES-53]
MASLRVLAFDHEGEPVQFDTWLDDLHLYLLSDSKDSVSLFDLASSAAPTPPATADTQALYAAVVTRYSSRATAALGRLLLPYLFPELPAFATVEDLVSHLRTSDAHYHATLSAEFLDRNQPPMFITLYFIVTRLPDSLRSVRDHFLSLDPTSLTVDLLEQHLLAAETSAVAVGAVRGTPRPPFFEGAATARAMVAGVVEVAALVVEVASGVVVGAAVEVVEAVEVVAAMELVEGVGVMVVAVEAAVGVAAVEAVGQVTVGLALSVLVLEVATISSSSVGARPSRPSSFTCGRLLTQHRCFSRLDDAWRAEFGDDVELPRWADLLRSRIAIFDLDFDAIISAMYVLSFSAEGDCYRCVPPDPGIAAAALGASESGTLPGTAPAEALHTFTSDSSASRCFFHDSTTLTPLPAPVTVKLADPFGGPVVARFSTVLPCPAVPTGSQVESVHTCYRAFSDSSVGPPPGSTLPATHSRHALSSSCLWSTQVSASPTALAGPALPSLCGWAAARCSSLLVSLDDCSPVDSPHGRDLPVLHLHSDRGGEFCSNLLRNFCHGEGILRSFTLPNSPQQNRIAERRIGLVMEVARNSMIHAAAPHFLWPFVVRYAAHQLNLWLCISFPETSPTLRWTGKVGDASVFRVWGSRAFVRDTSADKLSPHAIPCVFLGFVPDAPGWQFYHPTSRCVFPSQDV